MKIIKAKKERVDMSVQLDMQLIRINIERDFQSLAQAWREEELTLEYLFLAALSF